ncbi:MAG: hypothetical protein K2O33_01225, partial [Muribaculaceae bacterium]|nr:hypothetical protein [Muribaculaceae bacterium]
TTSFNMMQAVKRRFFAMRNGALAEQMKNAGAGYKINFGLLQSQVAEIAAQVRAGTLDERPEKLNPGEMAELARSLRANTTPRESMLIAPMVFPAALLSREEAEEWLLGSPTPEVADTLCLKLLRGHPDAAAIAAATLSSSESSDMQRYAALRLLLNLVACRKMAPAMAKDLAAGHTGSEVPMVSRLAAQIVERCEP